MCYAQDTNSDLWPWARAGDGAEARAMVHYLNQFDIRSRPTFCSKNKTMTMNKYMSKN